MTPLEQSRAEFKAMPDSLQISFGVVLHGDAVAAELFERGVLETLYKHLSATGQADLVRRLRVFYSSR